MMKEGDVILTPVPQADGTIIPTADAVNEALRFLIRITKENKPTSPGPGSRT